MEFESGDVVVNCHYKPAQHKRARETSLLYEPVVSYLSFFSFLSFFSILYSLPLFSLFLFVTVVAMKQQQDVVDVANLLQIKKAFLNRNKNLMYGVLRFLLGPLLALIVMHDSVRYIYSPKNICKIIY